MNAGDKAMLCPYWQEIAQEVLGKAVHVPIISSQQACWASLAALRGSMHCTCIVQDMTGRTFRHGTSSRLGRKKGFLASCFTGQCWALLLSFPCWRHGTSSQSLRLCRAFLPGAQGGLYLSLEWMNSFFSLHSHSMSCWHCTSSTLRFLLSAGLALSVMGQIAQSKQPPAEHPAQWHSPQDYGFLPANSHAPGHTLPSFTFSEADVRTWLRLLDRHWQQAKTAPKHHLHFPHSFCPVKLPLPSCCCSCVWLKCVLSRPSKLILEEKTAGARGKAQAGPMQALCWWRKHELSLHFFLSIISREVWVKESLYFGAYLKSECKWDVLSLTYWRANNGKVSFWKGRCGRITQCTAPCV